MLENSITSGGSAPALTSRGWRNCYREWKNWRASQALSTMCRCEVGYAETGWRGRVRRMDHHRAASAPVMARLASGQIREGRQQRGLNSRVEQIQHRAFETRTERHP